VAQQRVMNHADWKRNVAYANLAQRTESLGDIGQMMVSQQHPGN